MILNGCQLLLCLYMCQVESLGKQVSSLNARAAHTANSQLTLLQDENKRMVAERTVLQTQVETFDINFEEVLYFSWLTILEHSFFRQVKPLTRKNDLRGL